ncbi:hypothetical protein MRB53_004789 [Persea americana]|uniref:Uncharacterized protein n=1 Tax=Persea americana TaxID=3435 RepID=A0ACC2MCC5_PERAE|nr:hypothetical protein MRB53_004789 [Persea americana]
MGDQEELETTTGALLSMERVREEMRKRKRKKIRGGCNSFFYLHFLPVYRILFHEKDGSDSGSCVKLATDLVIEQSVD